MISHKLHIASQSHSSARAVSPLAFALVVILVGFFAVLALQALVPDVMGVEGLGGFDLALPNIVGAGITLGALFLFTRC